jgi:hypothetical protein
MENKDITYLKNNCLLNLIRNNLHCLRSTLKFPNDIMIFYGIYVQVIDNISWNLVFALFRPFLKLN